MAKAEVGRLNVGIQGKLDELKADLQEAKRRVEKTARDMEKVKPNLFGGLLAKGAVGVAAIVGSLGLIEGAFKGLGAASEAMKGNLGEARLLLESLPLGIGPVIGAFNRWRDSINGVAEAQKKLAEQQRKTAEESRKREAALQSASQLRTRLTRELNLAQVRERGPHAVARFRAFDDLRQTEAQINQQVPRDLFPELNKELQALTRELANIRLTQIQEREFEELKLQREQLEQQRKATESLRIIQQQAGLLGP